MAAMTFASNAIEVPADVDAGSVYLDLHDEVNDTPIHMVRLDMTEDQAVELATLLMLGVTKLRAARLERQEALDAAHAALEAERNVIEDFPRREASVQAAQRALRPCYCDSAYHPQGC